MPSWRTRCWVRPRLLDLYKQAAPDALLTGSRMSRSAQAKHAHPEYCLKMATGTGKTWVLQALLIWQLLNKTAALDEGRGRSALHPAVSDRRARLDCV